MKRSAIHRTDPYEEWNPMLTEDSFRVSTHYVRNEFPGMGIRKAVACDNEMGHDRL
jgi:hypothetical protein